MSTIFSSIDLLITTADNKILLFKRQHGPFKGILALVGGIQQPSESFNATIIRIMKQKLALKATADTNSLMIEGVGKAQFKQFKTYGSGSDVRGGNTTVFSIDLPVSSGQLIIPNVMFASPDNLPKLAFDHKEFIREYFYQNKNYAPANLGEIGVAIDLVIFTVKDNMFQVLLTKRSKEPYRGSYTLPGGFVKQDLSLSESASLILERDTNIKGAYLEQLYTFGDVRRDPRGRIIGITYYALLDSTKINLINSNKYNYINWFDVRDISSLKFGFDHVDIVTLAVDRVRNKIEYTNIAFQLLPDKFTLTELQEVYEAILDQKLDKRNFRKKVAELELLNELNEFKKVGRMRPAKYYEFKERKKETILRVKKWV